MRYGIRWVVVGCLLLSVGCSSPEAPRSDPATRSDPAARPDPAARSDPSDVDDTAARSQPDAKSWYVGRWVFDRKESARLNASVDDYAEKSEGVMDGHLTLQITPQLIILREKLDDERWDTSRLRIRSADVSASEARFEVGDGPFELTRRGERIYFSEPNGIKVCFRRPD